jgi:release factor glutamine methyltransferase
LTLHERLAAARDRLIRAGIMPAEAAIDVDLYARTILGWDRARILTRRQDPVPDSLEPRFSEWIARREQHEPTAYIVGMREFWGLEFLVTPAVLIPRPETEFIVEEALALVGKAAGEMSTNQNTADPQGRAGANTDRGNGAPGRNIGAPIRIADIGTGSGCIAVSIAHELPGCTVVATDVSDEALAVAKENALRHGVAARVECVATSYLDGVDGPFDLITANPPYVRDGDKRGLSRDVRHEPDVALFGGASGLRDIEGVLDTAVASLRAGGWFVMEFGFGQEDDVRVLANRRPELRFDHVRADLQGLARTAIMQRR